MKKFTATLLVLAALASSAFAHHNAGSLNAGDSISTNSGHLNLVF